MSTKINTAELPFETGETPFKESVNKNIEIPLDKFPESLRFWFQCNWENAYLYFDSGLICPASYYPTDVRSEQDVQSAHPSSLILSHPKKYIESKENQIFFEIILNDDDLKNLIKANVLGIYFFTKPLPISRITAIISNPKEKIIERLEKLIEAGSISFMPTSILEKFPNGSAKLTMPLAIENNSNYSTETSYFDKILGMFAFMKNANLYYGIYSNYSDNYFAAVASVFPKVEDYIELKESQKNFYSRLINKGGEVDINSPEKFLLETIFNDGIINKDYAIEYIKRYKNDPKLSRLQVQKLDNVLKIIKNPLEKIATLEMLSEKELGMFFQVVYISIYGDKKGDSKYKLKNSVALELPISKAESTLALLGLYYGYKSLSPHDYIVTNAKNSLSFLIDSNTNIKFKLDSRLDYISIEQVYQFIFNKIRLADTDFVISPESSIKKIKDLKSFEHSSNYDISRKLIMDVEYVKIKKNEEFILAKTEVKDDIKQYLKLIDAIYPSEISDECALITLCCKLAKNKLVRYGANGLYVRKVELMEFLYRSPPILDYLKACIEFDKIFNNKK